MKTLINILDHGFVKLLNIAGPIRRPYKPYDAHSRDPAIVARNSFDNMDEERTETQDMKLVRYLMEHRHCYHPSMEVLTANGWKRWDSLGTHETFVVPNTTTKKLNHERLEVKSFEIEEDLYCFNNSRMSYMVTSDHTMWHKPRGKKEYRKAKVQDIGKYGHFEPLGKYSYHDTSISPKHAFIGFYLGDGCKRSTNTIGFHLKKERKINYLKRLLATLEIPYTLKDSTNGIVDIYMYIPDWFSELVDKNKTTKFKRLEVPIGGLSLYEISGIFDGLVNSDGAASKERQQISYSSTSPELLSLFETCATYMGIDAHKNHAGITAYYGNRTSLESRPQYHSKKAYKGKVYCATTSTGMLVVRGDNSKFAFICGNTSPLEQIVVWLDMKLPIFIARQLVRHRTARLNEVSARYVQLPAEWYIPELENVGVKSKSNKQGRRMIVAADGTVGTLKGNIDVFYNRIKAWLFTRSLNLACWTSYKFYQLALWSGIPPELARTFLHVNHYTHWTWQHDLHNLLHLIRLRRDGHAQYEARVLADAIYEILCEALPQFMKLWDELEEENKLARRLLAEHKNK